MLSADVTITGEVAVLCLGGLPFGGTFSPHHGRATYGISPAITSGLCGFLPLSSPVGPQISHSMICEHHVGLGKFQYPQLSPEVSETQPSALRAPKRWIAVAKLHSLHWLLTTRNHMQSLLSVIILARVNTTSRRCTI
jgi:hypothetical protein